MTGGGLATAEELRLLRQSVRDTLTQRGNASPIDVASTGWETEWDRLAEQGLWSAIEPPDGSLSAAAVVAEELGRSLFAGPAPGAMACSYLLNNLAGSIDLPEALTGPSAVVVSGSLSCTPTGNGTGCLHPTLAMGPGTSLVIVSKSHQIFSVASDAVIFEHIPSLDISRRIVTPRLKETNLTAVHSRSTEVAELALAARALLHCADTLGCVDYVLERSVNYAKQRNTFGVPIGKYQAVAHRLVDHTITATQMRILLDSAITAFDTRAEDLRRHLATAQTFFAGRGTNLISDCVQLAGAIGFTWEFGFHLYLRRVVDNATLSRGHQRPARQLAAVCPW